MIKLQLLDLAHYSSVVENRTCGSLKKSVNPLTGGLDLKKVCVPPSSRMQLIMARSYLSRDSFSLRTAGPADGAVNFVIMSIF